MGRFWRRIRTPRVKEPPGQRRRRVPLGRSRVRVFLGHLCTEWPQNPAVASLVAANGKGARGRWAGAHRGGIWGSTGKRRCVSNAAAARAPARRNTLHQACTSASGVRVSSPSYSCITPGRRGESATRSVRPVKCAKALPQPLRIQPLRNHTLVKPSTNKLQTDRSHQPTHLHTSHKHKHHQTYPFYHMLHQSTIPGVYFDFSFWQLSFFFKIFHFFFLSPTFSPQPAQRTELFFREGQCNEFSPKCLNQWAQVVFLLRVSTCVALFPFRLALFPLAPLSLPSPSFMKVVTEHSHCT